jgi:replicative DNA helicase
MKYLYDEKMQMKIIKYLIQENKVDYVDYLSEDFFDGVELKQIFDYIKKKTIKIWNVPGFDIIAHECGGIFLKKDIVPELKQKILLKLAEMEKIEILPLEVKLVVKDFIVAQEMRKHLLKLNQDFQLGVYDILQYQQDLTKIANIEVERKQGIFISEYDIEKVTPPEKIPTHLSTLNTWLKGGLGKGEIGFVFGQSEIGKTFFLVNLAVAAYKIGKMVFYYSFEISEYYLYMRIASRLTGYTDDDILTKPIRFKTRISKRLPKKAALYVKEFPSEGATINQIRADMDAVRLERGIVPDIVLIDYADIMKPLRYHEEDWRMVAENATAIRRLAKERNVATWTVSQIKTEYWYKKFKAAAGGRSIRKVDIADVVLGMYTTEEEPENMNRIVIAALKLRRSKKPKKELIVRLNRDKSLMEEE